VEKQWGEVLNLKEGSIVTGELMSQDVLMTTSSMVLLFSNSVVY